MGWFTGIIVFLLVWWTVIFTVLPWSLRRDETGKPDDPKLKQKLFVTTLVSAVLWLAVYFLVEADIISFREMAATMAEESTAL